MDVALRLAIARARASLELRARPGGGGRRPKKMKGLARPAKTGPGAACGTGKGGFQSGNVCALEDGIPDKPKSFAKGGALKKSNPKADRKKAAEMKAKAAAKTASKQAVDKKKSIEAKRKKAAIRKKEKEAKKAADDKAAAAAVAEKKQAMLQKIRVKKANEKIDVVGTPKSVADELKEAKTSLASKKLVVAKTPKSIKEEIDDIKAAAAAKESAAKAKAEELAKAAYEKAKVEAAAAEKAAAEIAAKRAAEKAKPVPARKVDDPEELAPKPAFSTPNPDQLTTVKTLGGSTGAVLAEANGQKFVVKAGKTPGHIANESQADELYAAAGVAVPRQQLHVDANGVQKKVAEFINGKTLGDLKVQDKAKYDAAVKKLQKDFVADALLGNYDVVGMNLDNIVVKGGKVYRVDNGGSLTFRAQGKNKPFTDDVTEISTLRDSSVNSASAGIFGSLSDKEISAQITKLLKRKELILAAARTEELRLTLGKRMESLQKWQDDYKKSTTGTGGKFYKAPSLQKGPIDGNNDPIFSNKAEPGYADVVVQSIPKGSPTNAADWIAAKATTTHAGIPWKERIKIGKEVEKSLTGAEKDAAQSWGGSNWSFYQNFEAAATATTTLSPKYAAFMSMKDKLPEYVGGVLYRKMELSLAKVEKILKAKRYSHAKSDDLSGQGVHQSYSTTYGLAHSWQGGSGDRSVIIAITKHRGTKDGVGIVGLGHEAEVLPNPDAQYRVRRTYFTYTGHGSSFGDRRQKLEKVGLVPGQPVTEKQYLQYLKKAGLSVPVKNGAAASLHSNPDLHRIIEVEEIVASQPGNAAKLWAQKNSAKAKAKPKKKTK